MTLSLIAQPPIIYLQWNERPHSFVGTCVVRSLILRNDDFFFVLRKLTFVIGKDWLFLL